MIIPAEQINGSLGRTSQWNAPGSNTTITVFATGRHGTYSYQASRDQFLPPGTVWGCGNCIIELAALWQMLTQDEKDSWKPLARRHKTTAYNQFIRVNLQLRLTPNADPNTTYNRPPAGQG